MTVAPPVEGQVTIRVHWDGRCVRQVAIQSQRPQPTVLLRGKPWMMAESLIPRLYSLCGEAQSVAVAALGHWQQQGSWDQAPRTQWARQVHLEVIREHLWRLGMDWRQLLGWSPEIKPLQTLMRQRTQWLSDPWQAQSWAEQVLHTWFGPPALTQGLLDVSGVGDDPARLLRQWWHTAPTPLAALLRELQPRLQGLGVSPLPLFASEALPGWVATLPERLRADAGYARQPDWAGCVYEMGPLARCQTDRLLRLERFRSDGLIPQGIVMDAWRRVLARVVELLRGLQGIADPAELEIAAITEDDWSVVAFPMARGILAHAAVVENGMIQAYQIIAPTEWNFHPEGPAAHGLMGLAAADKPQLQARIAEMVMALDPCVRYSLEIDDA